MHLSRFTARSPTAIPMRLRGRLVVRKVAAGWDGYLGGLPGTMTEWNSPEDGAAWRDL